MFRMKKYHLFGSICWAAAASLISGTCFADGVRCGRVALHTWLTTAEFKDISVTAPDGKVLWRGLPDPATCEVGKEGKWTVDGTVIRQSNEAATTGGTLVFGDSAWGDYTFKAKARKLSGKEGFILHVRERSPEYCIYANYGGWFNKQHGVETRGNNFDFATPLKKDCTKAPIETGRWYDLEMTCAGDKVTMKLDGACLFSSVDVPEITFGGGENKIVVDASKARFPVSEDMWGIFFEDIDLSLDGGVYAELVRNRSFEDGLVKFRAQGTIGFWSTVGRATIELDSSKPISEKNRHCGRVEALPGGGVANDGYFGIAVKDGAQYRLSVALRGDVKGPIEVALQSLGKTLATGAIGGIGPEWKTYSLTLTATGTDPDAKLVFRATNGLPLPLRHLRQERPLPQGPHGAPRRAQAELRALPRRLLGGGQHDGRGVPLEADDRQRVGPSHAVEPLGLLERERRRLPRVPAALRGPRREGALLHQLRHEPQGDGADGQDGRVRAGRA